MNAVLLLLLFVFTEEEAAEVKKNKLYRPSTKFVPQNVSPVQSDFRRPVSCLGNAKAEQMRQAFKFEVFNVCSL